MYIKDNFVFLVVVIPVWQNVFQIQSYYGCNLLMYLILSVLKSELQLLTLTIRRTRNNGSSVNIQVLYVDNQQFASNYTHQLSIITRQPPKVQEKKFRNFPKILKDFQLLVK